MDNKKVSHLIVLFYSTFSLSLAHFLEFKYGWHPCKLCILQRIPLYLILIIYICTYINLFDKESLLPTLFFFLSMLLITSLFHTGVTFNLFANNSCSQNVILPSNSSDLMDLLNNNTLVIDCKDSNKKIFGINLSIFNNLFSIVSMISLYKYAKQKTN